MQRTYAHKKGWFNVRGNRYYLKSSYEFIYASFLELLLKQKVITHWEYEPDTFYFDGIKRGTNNYTPDFKVHKKNGTIEYHEVKGYLDPESKTKLKRMKKYHPEIKMLFIGAEFFRKNRAVLTTFEKAITKYGDKNANN